jgi:hypothetical protein
MGKDRMLRPFVSLVMAVHLLLPPGMCVCGTDAVKKGLCGERCACPSYNQTRCSASNNSERAALTHSSHSCDGSALASTTSRPRTSQHSIPDGRTHAPGCPACLIASHFKLAVLSSIDVAAWTCWDAPALPFCPPTVRPCPHIDDQVASGPPIYLAACTLLI